MLRSNYYLLISVIFGSLLVIRCISSHPCTRPCDGKPMLCEYNFTVENYFVLSKACYSCPFVQSDCFRPHCVSTNGLQRPIITVNRQLPGPAIEVCKGDIIRVNVFNNMDSGSATSMHWHGLQQRNSCYMDGVPGLTQCSIPPRETFRYEFFAHNSGTHWYHSHTAMQFGDGSLGPLIVREPENAYPNHALYDVDASDHVMTVHDWADRSLIDIFIGDVHDFGKRTQLKALVNGRGQYLPIEDINNITGFAVTPPPTLTPFPVFNVTQGMRYRFRLIGAMTQCNFRVMIDDHQMTVIAADGNPLNPAVVGSFFINPGERFDFVLDANAVPGNYWIKFEGHSRCSTEGHAYAILHYNSATMATPSGNMTDFSQTGVVFNPSPDEFPDVPTIMQHEMRSGKATDENFDDEKVDVVHYISLDFIRNDNSRYANAEYYPNPTRRGISSPTMNNITMWFGPAPLVTQWNDVIDKRLCNKDKMNTVTECNDDLCHCSHIVSADLGQTVELFIASHTRGDHPMHLHGHTFRLVGSGMRADNSDYLQDVIAQDKAGVYPRMLDNPMYRDTVTVYGGGYNILRFKADNPGIWFFHCHVETHLMEGMSMAIQVGDPKDFPYPHIYFPQCGGFSNRPNNITKCQVCSGTNRQSSPVTTVLFMFIILTSLF